MNKFMNLEEQYKQQYNTIVSPEDVPGLLTIKKRKRPTSTKPIRVTQVHGSMEGKKILEEVQKLRAEKDRAEEVKLAKKNEKEEKLMAFLRCKDKCVCKNRVCLAFNL